MNWTEQELAYFAGIIDGEGCISFRIEWSGKYLLRIHFSHTSKELIDWMIKRFPSRYWLKKTPSNWRQRYDWLLNTSVQDAILPRILPYMVVKKAHIELAIEYRKTIMKRKTGTYRITPELIAQRATFIHKFKILNKRGTQDIPPCLPSA